MFKKSIIATCLMLAALSAGAADYLWHRKASAFRPGM